MKKMKDNSWIVALLAAILSFLFIVLSIVFSDYFQENIYDFNTKILKFFNSYYNGTIDFYMNVKNCTVDICSKIVKLFDKLEDAGLAPYVPFCICGAIVLLELGLTRSEKINVSVNKFYSFLLKQYHISLSLKALFRFIIIIYFISIVLANFAWYNKDVPSQLCASISSLIIIVSGYVYKNIFLCFYKRTHLTKGCMKDEEGENP